jgi:hypothetical protein
VSVVAATGVDTDLFHAVVFDPDTDRCLARAVEHASGEYVDLFVGTQSLTIAPNEIDGAITVLGWYARARAQRLHDQAEQALARALDEVGERR